MKSLLCIFLFWIIFSFKGTAQENQFSPLISGKIIAFSPIGLSIQLNPVQDVGVQLSFQHSIWSESWRATADLKIYPGWLIDQKIMANIYFGPYFRYKDVEVYSINMTGKDCTGFCGDYLQGYFAGLNAGSEIYFKFINIDFNGGLGLSTDKYLYSIGFQYIDIRVGISIGFHGKFKNKS